MLHHCYITTLTSWKESLCGSLSNKIIIIKKKIVQSSPRCEEGGGKVEQHVTFTFFRNKKVVSLCKASESPWSSVTVSGLDSQQRLVERTTELHSYGATSAPPHPPRSLHPRNSTCLCYRSLPCPLPGKAHACLAWSVGTQEQCQRHLLPQRVEIKQILPLSIALDKNDHQQTFLRGGESMHQSPA